MVLMLALSARAAWALSCGDTLIGGSHVLTADLDCSNVSVPVVLTLDSASLDLAGYRVVAQEGGDLAIMLVGTGAQVYNGEVYGWFGVVADGVGGHVIRDLSINSFYGPVALLSDGNVARSNTVLGEFGITVSGDDNRVSFNEVDVFDSFLEVSGHHNVIHGNRARASERGMRVTGDDNLIHGNVLIGGDPVDIGIRVEGVGNTLLRNTAQGFLLDASDAHGTCDENIWRRNEFETGDPACVLHTTRRDHLASGAGLSRRGVSPHRASGVDR